MDSSAIGPARSAPAGDGRQLAPDALPLRPVLAFHDPGYESDFVRFYNGFDYRYAQPAWPSAFP